MKKIIALLLVLVTILSMAACGTKEDPPAADSSKDNASAENASDPAEKEDDAEPTHLRVAITATPPTLDIHTSGAGAILEPAEHIWERLFTMSSDSTVIPQLASSYDVNDDYTEFIIHLRKGILFHNLKEMTSADVIATFDRYAVVGYRAASVFGDNLVGYEAVDEYTVKVSFKKPFNLFILELANAAYGPIYIMPAEVKDVPANGLEAEHVIGTGPFKFVEFIPDQYFAMEKFEEYVPDTTQETTGFGGYREALVDKLTLYIVPEKTTRLNGLLTGEYDYVQELDTTSYYELEHNPNVKPDIAGDKWIPICLTNTMAGPLTDPKVVEAIRVGISDEAILLAAAGSEEFYTLNHSFFPVGSPYWSEAGSEYYNQGNIEVAKAILAESDYQGEEVIISTSQEYAWMYQFAVVLQSQLQAIGLNAVLDVVDWATVVERVGKDPTEKGYSFSTTGMALVDVFDPSSLNGLYATVNNATAYDSPRTRELLELISVETDIEVRKELTSELMTLIIKEMGVLCFGYMDTLAGASADYNGLETWYQIRMWNTTID